ncbi:MAG: hypothetical protein RPT13_03865 [SAR324 cluster bacterium]|jgi:hypothetical protein
MTFDELVAEVYLITNRPDLVSETKSAIKAATLKAHKTDFYSKDIFEVGVDFTSAGFRQSLDYITLITNFRALSYLRRVKDENDDLGKFFDVVTPHEVLDSYGKNRADIAYIAGRVLEIRSSVSFDKMLLGAYVLPIVREGAYLSWVAEQFPFAIIHEASRRLFKSIGQLDESNAQRELVAEEYNELKVSALSDVGY